MVWFEGSIMEGITKAKTSLVPLLVIIVNGEEDSVIMESFFLQDEIIEYLQDNAVALRIEEGSQDFSNFSQVYAIKAIPSFFVINPVNGSLIEIYTSIPEGNSLKNNLEISKELIRSQKTENQQQPQTSQAEGSTSTTPNPSEQTFSNLTEEEKREQLKMLREKIAIKVKEKEEQRKAEELERELKRRKEGKELLQVKESLEEKQLKLLAEQRKKEKKEDEEVRRKIREQIAFDRAEKAKEKAQPQNQEQPFSNNVKSDSSPRGDISNIVVRLTDGQSLKNRFASSNTLADIRKYIEENRTDGQTPFVMLTNFPYRYLTEYDMTKTLLDLGFVPSGTIILKPTQTVSHAYTGTSVTRVPRNDPNPNTSGILGFLTLIFTPIISFLNRIWHGLTAPPPTAQAELERGGNSTTQERAQQTSKSQPPSRIKQLSDLNSEPKKDEDSKFYNGNSLNFDA